MSRLVVVAPLRPGSRRQVEELLAEGPPFDLEATRFDSHLVFLTDEEAVFVFEGAGDAPTLHLQAEDPALLLAAEAWREHLAGRPRRASTAFSWSREG